PVGRLCDERAAAAETIPRADPHTDARNLLLWLVSAFGTRREAGVNPPPDRAVRDRHEQPVRIESLLLLHEPDEPLRIERGDMPVVGRLCVVEGRHTGQIVPVVGLYGKTHVWRLLILLTASARPGTSTWRENAADLA